VVLIAGMELILFNKLDNVLMIRVVFFEDGPLGARSAPTTNAEQASPSHKPATNGTNSDVDQ
jgi:hypothetical protein